LANIEAPAFVAVVGKPNLYQTEDGNIIISLRAESIQKVDEETRNQWIMDTARRTQERLQALKEAGPVSISGDFSTANKVASSPVQDAKRALEHYHTDIEHYRGMLIRALSSLRSDLASGGKESKIKTEAKIGAEIEQVLDEEEKPAAKKSKPKKSGSLSGWPEQDNADEVETFNLGKKS
jgi:hypothetical protein